LRGEHTALDSLPVRLLHNKFLSYGVKLAQNWAAHFNPEFLFIDGDKIRRSNCPGIGQLYWLEVVGLFFGLVALIKKWRKELFFFLVWLVVAPLPAALTFQSPPALRSHSLVVPVVFLIGSGWLYLWELIKKPSLKKLFVLTLLLTYAWQAGYFLNNYLVHYSYREPQVWEGGFEELVSFLGPIKKEYDKIYVTDAYDQPYILFLFFMQYPPEKFQQESVLTERDKFFFSTVRDFDRFHFEAIDWDNLEIEGKALVVGTPREIPLAANIIHEVLFPNGEVAFRVVER
ncbi:hypothetical protein MUP65_01505, partial [Patescibacteria group bacterium]|nr:hypothetical protein [Patescibacteria group bacterium]